jgi:hypothetical protein
MLKRYYIKRDRVGSWAHIVIATEIGFFSAVSDYGNYSYIWVEPGMEFRQFLCGLNVDYLRGKLLHGWLNEGLVFDSHATAAAIKDAITARNEAVRKEKGTNWKYTGEEIDLLAHLFEAGCGDEEDFEAWQSETHLDDPWEYGAWKSDPAATAFCEKVFRARFVPMLQAELEYEAKTTPTPKQTARDEAFARDLILTGEAEKAVSDAAMAWWRSPPERAEGAKAVLHAAWVRLDALQASMCAHCKKKTVAYPGAIYCGAACTARAEAHEPSHSET